MKTLLMCLMVGLALISASSCVTAAERRPETAGELLDDATVTTKVNALIVGDVDAHYFQIDVTTTQGEVLLQGNVRSSETEARLLAKIRAMPGVRGAQSKLHIDQR